MSVRFCIAWILLATTPAPAATITVSPQTTDRPTVVMIEGSLVALDEEQFAAKTASLSSAFVALSSDGGSLATGVQIGEVIRRKKLLTIIPDGRRCASACALAWLGGVERFIGSEVTCGKKITRNNLYVKSTTFQRDTPSQHNWIGERRHAAPVDVGSRSLWSPARLI